MAIIIFVQIVVIVNIITKFSTKNNKKTLEKVNLGYSSLKSYYKWSSVCLSVCLFPYSSEVL